MQSIPPCRTSKDRQNTSAIVVTTGPVFDVFFYKNVSFFIMDKNGDTAPLNNESFSSTRKFVGVTSIITQITKEKLT